MNFEVGQTYEMKTRGIDRDSNGYDYIALVSDDKGDEKKDYRVYNFMKGFYEELPHTIPVIVNYIDAFGKVKFHQNEPQILQEHYEKDKMYSFHIIGTDTDGNGKSYYHIEDDFAKQRYYYVGDAIHNIGDDIVLKVCGTVESSGYLYFEEVTPPANIVASTPIVKVKRTSGNGKYYVNYGPESKTLEYKTSIAFPPSNNGVADIDKQMPNIVRALTAMMNAEGGKLVIGVHDKTQEVKGVEDDFLHLNDGDIDKYAGQYPLNDDGYKRKILNSVRYMSGTYAGSLLDVKPQAKGGMRYYVVEVMKADRPIWMRTPQGTILFQRHDGSNQQLWGDELTQFIVRRMQKSIYERDDNLNLTKDLESIMEKALTDIINKRHSTNVVIPSVPTLTVDYWVVWNNKGEWCRQRAKVTSCYVQLPVYKNMSKPVLLLCYKNAKLVAAMDWNKTRSGVNLNITQASLWKGIIYLLAGDGV